MRRLLEVGMALEIVTRYCSGFVYTFSRVIHLQVPMRWMLKLKSHDIEPFSRHNFTRDFRDHDYLPGEEMIR